MFEYKERYDFVLDCSVTMTWCFEDESNPYCDNVLDSLMNKKAAVVPAVWPLEVTNVLLLGEKKRRVTSLQIASFVIEIESLPITIDDIPTSMRTFNLIWKLAQELHLTAYDASYLEIAMREKLPIATLDKQLISAAKELNIPLFEPSASVLML